MQTPPTCVHARVAAGRQRLMLERTFGTPVEWSALGFVAQEGDRIFDAAGFYEFQPVGPGLLLEIFHR